MDGDSVRELDFGSAVRRHRVAAGLTQEELAERAKVSPRSIGDIERGISRAPQRNTVGLLADALGLSGDERRAFEASARRRPSLDPAPIPIADSPRVKLIDPPAPPLFGRGAEVTLLERQLTTGGSPVLVLAGEPGLGKSRLLAEAAWRSAQRGWCVLEDGCQRRGSQEPFAPLLGALKGFLSRRAPSALHADLDGCAWLVRLLPELAGTIGDALPAWTLAPEQERRLMFEAVGRFLANVARREAQGVGTGILLVLDDLQWAGRDALDLLDALVRSTATGAAGEPQIVRIVCAYRDTEVRPADALATLLADWAHAGLVVHRALPTLTAEECRQLLDSLLVSSVLGAPGDDPAPSTEDAALRERVLQRTSGVPFFVVSYAQALRRGDVGQGAEHVPWTVAQGVRQRVAALPEPARALLATAAVVGRVAQPALLSRVMARPEDEILGGLEAACQARLLLDAEHDYRFPHDVVREVVEGDIGSARRALLHRRVAAAIEEIHADRLPDQYETLAYHYVNGQAWERALDFLVRSGDRARSAGAIGEALNMYAQALGVCERLGASAEATALAVAEKRGFVLFDRGDFLDAVVDFDRMRVAAERFGDRHREGLALAYAGMAAYYGHAFEDAERRMRAALVIGSEGYDDVRLSASVQLGSLLMVIDRQEEAAPWQQMAEDLAPLVDDPASRAWWAVTGAETLHWSGRYVEAMALLDRWRDAVTASQQLLLYLYHTWEEALACGGMGNYQRALDCLDEPTTTYARIGDNFIRARALNTAGWIYGELQHHRRALDLNQQSLDAARAIETADSEITNNAHLNLGDSLLALGRLDEAEEHYLAVQRIVQNPSSEDRWMLWRLAQHLTHSYGELWLARGDTARAFEYADDCLERSTARDSKKNIAKARRLRGQVLLAHGELPAAEAELARGLDVARQIGNPPQIWKTLVALGDVRQAAGDAPAAQRAYRDALAIIEDVASRLRDAGLRDVFLTSAHVQDIRRCLH